MFRNNFNNQLRCNFSWFIRINNILKFTHGNVHGNITFFKICVSNQLVECAFQFTNVGFDVFSNIIQNIITQIDLFRFYFFTKNCHSCLVIRVSDICHQTTFKTGTNTFFQGLHFFWWSIRCNDNLFSG